VLQAWYPGAQGGEAIARVLFGEVNPSGRLPVTFPGSPFQLPAPGAPDGGSVTYHEGSDVGYRWFAKNQMSPLFPFGYGESYTSFRYSGLSVSGGETVRATFTVTNTGALQGIDTPQVYLTSGPGRRQQRLIGWQRVALRPGESRQVTVTADPRLLANWDEAARGWRIDAGDHAVALGKDAASLEMRASARLQGRSFRP
jgi:beta-glucosidase